MKKNLLFGCLIIGILTLPILTGCSKDQKSVDSETTAEMSESGSQGAQLAARVNGAEISQADLERAVKNLMMRNGMDTSRKDAFMNQLGSRILDQLIDGKLLYQEAAKNGFEPDPEKVDEVMAKLAGSHETQEDFKSEMKARGFTEDILKDKIREQLTIQKYVDETIVPKAVVPDETVRAAYDQNPERFVRPEEVRASHILIKSNESDPQDKKDAALKKATEIAALAKQKDADFAALAKKNSEGPSASKGGDLGFFHRGQMVKPFEDKAFSMKIGEISDPVLTRFGYHIIKVTDHRKSSKISYEEVKDKLAEDLKQRMVNELVQQKVEELRKNAKIETFFKPSSPSESTTSSQD